MKNFLKQYIGLIGAVVLTGGSLFAFNISTSIDNALQVIKTIWVTSDGTTNNPPFMTMDGSGKYVSIGTTGTAETVNVSGSMFVQDNEVGFFAGNDGSNAFGYPIPGIFMGIDGTASSGAIAGISVYDTRPVEFDGKLGINISSRANIGVNGLEAESSLNTNKGDRMDLKVEDGFDLSNYDEQNHTGFVTSHNRAEVNIDPDHITIFTETGVVRTATGSNGDFDYSHSRGSRIDVDTDYIHIYGSGGYANMYFNSAVGLFGFAQNNPGNTIDIGGGYVPGTLGLRFSGWAGNAGQVLGLNNAGDVVLLGTLGGGSSGPREYGAGSPQSAQIKGAGNTSNGSYAVVGGLNNIGNGYASFVGGGLYNEATNSGNVAVGGAYNKSYGLLLSSIVGGTNNTINSGGNVSFIGGGSDNIINERNSAIVVGSNNLIDAVSSAVVGGEYNTIHGSASQSFIGGGTSNNVGNALSIIVGGESNTASGYGDIIVGGISNIVNSMGWSAILGGQANILSGGGESVLVGGSENTLVGNFAFLGGGRSNITNANYGFIGGGFSHVLAVGALYSLIVGGENNSITDRYSSIVGGLNNLNQSEKSFIGGGEKNNIDLDSGLSSIVGGSGNILASGSTLSFIGGGSDNIIENSFMFGGSNIVGGNNNHIEGGIAASIVGGIGNYAGGGGGMFIGGGGDNHADGDGMVVVGGSHNWAGSISGVGVQSFIGGGSENTILDSSRSSIVGGHTNRIEEGSDLSSIAGGIGNTIYNGKDSAIIGGSQNTLSGTDFSIVGGTNNFASGTASVVLGRDSQVLGSSAFAFGDLAQALHPHTFVWNDGGIPFASMQSNTFLIHASAGVGINTNDTNGKSLRVSGSIQADDYYSSTNTAGITTAIINIGGGGCDMYFEDGLLVSTSGC